MEPAAVLCVQCGWDARTGETVQRESAGVSATGLGGPGAKCYFEFSGTGTGVGRDIRDRVEEYLDDEEVEFEYVKHEMYSRSPLEPQDLRVSCDVTEFDYGSRAIRYWLTMIAAFGPGSCKLGVRVTVEDGQGSSEEFRANARQFIGFFGGSDEGLMKANIKAVSNRIATRVTRFVAGRWFINRRVYQFALASLILGMLSFLMCFPLALIGLGLGISAVAAITSRGLPKRSVMAICGIVLCGLGLIVSPVLLYLVINS